MAIISTDTVKVRLPKQLDTSMLEDTRNLSTVAKLSAREAQRFGEVDYIMFNDLPRAEFVEEGAQKAPTNVSYQTVKATPKKAQVTLRFNEEVLWADEDYQLGVLSEVAQAGSVALSRALDLGLYHRINPLTGTAIDAWTNYVNATTNRVELAVGTDADAVIREAVGLVINGGGNVNGLALDPKMSWDLAGLQALSGGQPTGTPATPAWASAPTSRTSWASTPLRGPPCPALRRPLTPTFAPSWATTSAACAGLSSVTCRSS